MTLLKAFIGGEPTLDSRLRGNDTGVLCVDCQPLQLADLKEGRECPIVTAARAAAPTADARRGERPTDDPTT